MYWCAPGLSILLAHSSAHKHLPAPNQCLHHLPQIPVTLRQPSRTAPTDTQPAVLAHDHLALAGLVAGHAERRRVAVAALAAGAVGRGAVEVHGCEGCDEVAGWEGGGEGGGGGGGCGGWLEGAGEVDGAVEVCSSTGRGEGGVVVVDVDGAGEGRDGQAGGGDDRGRSWLRW